jgi:hypothetical protein
MQAPGGIQMQAAERGARLNVRVKQDPSGKAEIGQFGIDVRTGPEHEPQSARLAQLQKSLEVLARIRGAPVELAWRCLVDAPGNIGLDELEAERLHTIQDPGPPLWLQTPVMHRAAVHRDVAAIDQQAGLGDRHRHGSGGGGTQAEGVDDRHDAANDCPDRARNDDRGGGYAYVGTKQEHAENG